jgi:hypothetical protein
MPFDPVRDGWPLDEAVMRLSDPEALVNLAHSWSVAADRLGWSRPSRWWLEDIAPAPAGGESGRPSDQSFVAQCRAVERAFADALIRGEIAGWARPHSPLARHERVPVDAWPVLSAAMYRRDWHNSEIKVVEIRGRTVSPPARTPFFRHGSQESAARQVWPYPRAWVESETNVLLRLYNVRIQPPEGIKPIGKSASEARCREWLAGLMRAQPDAPRPKAELEEEAHRTFRLGQRAFGRAWRGALAAAGPAWSRAGPRKSRR